MLHPSIIEEGNSLKLTAESPAVLGCPLCPIFTTRSARVIQRHLQNHEANAVRFQGKIIIRCNLRCRDVGHFHCPFCGGTMLRKDAIKRHLVDCKSKCETALLASVAALQAPSPHKAAAVCVAPSLSPPPSASVVSLDHLYSQPSSSETPACAPEEPERSQSPPATPSEKPIAKEEPVTVDVPPTHTQCLHCHVVLYKKNLLLHVQRKHGSVKDITAKSHLQSTFVDPSNGLYAVKKTSRGFSVPVHVQRKTWTEKDVTRCEMEKCRQNHLLAQQSGRSHSLCHHIRSLDYCETTGSEARLDDQVLQDMVDNHFLAASTVAVCKTRRREAEDAHVPLSVLVDLQGSENHICLSIHEPVIHHYSALGRVFVTYSVKTNTWHCPCTKSRSFCAHRDVAKWHLFQTHNHFFKTVPPTATSATTTESVCHFAADTEGSASPPEVTCVTKGSETIG